MSLARLSVSVVFVALLIYSTTAASKRDTCNATAEDIEGPYYQPGAPDRTDDAIICYSSPAGDRVVLSGYVYNQDCSKALANTKLDIWQANPTGAYSEGQSKDSYDYNCRGVLYTDSNGYYEFKSLMPGRYDDGGYRPAHIHWKITPQSPQYTTLTTQLYFKLDTYLFPNDSCTDCNSKDPSLVVEMDHLKDIKTYVGTWNIVMAPTKNAPATLVVPEKKISNNYSQKKEHIQPTIDKSVAVNQSTALSYLAVGAACITIGALAAVAIIQVQSRIRRRNVNAV